MTDDFDGPVKLLLVDDQPKNLLALQAILEPLGPTLVTATSGTEALKRMLEGDYAAILLDVQMPDMDGFETATLIRNRPRSRHTPIIFLTALNKDQRFIAKGYEVGAVDYLTKPFDADVLRSKIAIFVELFRKNQIILQQAELLAAAKERELAEVRRAGDERYSNLAESMPQIVWVTDGAGVLRYCNRRWFECAGRPEGAPAWEDVLHPSDRAPFFEQWSRAIVAGEAWQAEFRLGDVARGAWRWHLVRALPVRADRRRTWIGTFTDIDDRRSAEDSLRLLAEASTVLASSIDSESALGKVALLAVPLLGDGATFDVCVEGGALRQVAAVHAFGEFSRHGSVASADDSRLALAAARACATGQRQLVSDAASEPLALSVGDSSEARAAGAPEVTSYMTVPIRSRDQVLGVMTFFTVGGARRIGAAEVGVAEDLARRVAAAMDNTRLFAIAERERKELEEANRAKDVFLATLSHELRTPLNAMMGWTQILRSGRLDAAKFNRAVDTIDRNARAQAQLISDLLDVSRIVTGKLIVESVTLDLAPVVEGAIDAARPGADAKHVALEARIAPGIADLEGDPVRLQQIVGNLLSNAIKFTPAGGSVNVSLDRSGKMARLRVADSGQGISPEFLPLVFESFRQADSTTTRSHGGLGLGLAIVKRLVELHRGTVRAESEGLGKGAAFTVELPLLFDRDVVEERGRTRRSADAPKAAIAQNALGGVHILVVEDDPDGRELVETVLRQRGARVTAVSTSKDAMAALANDDDRPTLLVSDIGLPGEDGFALIRRVRGLSPEKGGALPAIALTAYVSRQDADRALTAGFDAHVAKPVNPGDLAIAVARLAKPRDSSKDGARGGDSERRSEPPRSAPELRDTDTGVDAAIDPPTDGDAEVSRPL